MQKVINVLAVVSFGVSAAIVAGGVYVYQNKDSITDNIKQQVIEAATSGVTDALPGLLGGSGIPSVGSGSSSPLPLPVPTPSLPF